MKIINTIIIALAIIGCGYLIGENLPVFSGAGGGLISVQREATTTAIGPQETIEVFAKRNSGCSSRIIGTKALPMLVLFGDPSNGDVASTTMSGNVGFWQEASTTKAYDTELYGCGRWFGYSYSSTTIITSEQY